jgi:Xaa-Pro aminopeptidase
MKSDLDALMEAEDLDALLIIGSASHNPPMMYLTGGGHVTQADLIKKRGEPAILYCWPMERDEAARSGLTVYVHDMQAYNEDLRRNGGNFLEAHVRRYQRLFNELGLVAGRVALYGKFDAGHVFGIFSALQERLPELRFVGQVGESVLLSAMATKDEQEVERIRRMGQITTEVIAETADFLTSHAVQDEVLIKADGRPLTIGDVRRRIHLWLAERNVENPQGVIFAIGRDAGVPHSSGNDADVLRLGQTIVYDIYPCEAGGGYYYDITRTWCLGYAPDAAQKLYEDVLAVYQQLRSRLRVGTSAREHQAMACDLFEARGHVTVRSDPQTLNGYVHSLGHGVGLNIHESPMLSLTAPETQQLKPGMVITLEPGLYYPERGMGVRLEDTCSADAQGLFQPLVEYPVDLILPMKSGR